MKELDRVSMILMTKKVCASKAVSVVSHVVGRRGLSIVLIVRVRLV